MVAFQLERLPTPAEEGIRLEGLLGGLPELRFRADGPLFTQSEYFTEQ